MYVNHENITIILESSKERRMMLNIMNFSKEVIKEMIKDKRIPSTLSDHFGITELCECNFVIEFIDDVINNL